MNKIKARVKSRIYPLSPHFLKRAFQFPEGAITLSLETALNSRCTSDYDGDPTRFHWGMFDENRKLSIEQIGTIFDFAKTPRFTDHYVEILADQNTLAFTVDSRVNDIQKDWVMVESGMQQQAVGLVCAAFGVGMVFRNLGVDGTAISDSKWGTIKILLNPMKPSYDGQFWSSFPPMGVSSWLKGNLPDPSRDGNNALLTLIGSVATASHSSQDLLDRDISQLLWAARGRTPHLHNSKPWGMTVPTWAGKQNISSVYLLQENELFQYINWASARPTHSLSLVTKLDEHQTIKMKRSFPPYKVLIILCTNERTGRALWEIGYQIQNLLLQAHSLQISYRAILLDESQKNALDHLKLDSPVAMLAV
jgi:hypothetical protein